jgi:hypothetical protein
MKEDVQLNWTSFAEKRERFFSHAGAETEALNWGTGIFATGLCVTFAYTRRKKANQSQPFRFIGIPAILGIVSAGAIYFALPKSEVRLVKAVPGGMKMSQFELQVALRNADSLELDKIRAATASLLAAPTNDLEWTNWNNYFLGGRIHEEDSPGNYILRENNGRLEFVTFDANGAEQVQALSD